MASAIRVFGKRLMSTVTTTTTTAAVPPKRGRPAGILKVVPVSKPLGEFLGVPQVSRTDAVKKIFGYINDYYNLR
ncbi:TRI1-like protein, partial [Tanacetum coccineum]